jgi:diguanylate cyclase (GGDEF)-like protein
LPLLGLVEGLRAATSLEAMLQEVTDGAAALLGASRVSLRLLDENRTRLLVVARTGEALHSRGGAEFVVGEGLAGWVAQHGAPLRIDHADADPRFAPKPGMISTMRSFLGVPLLDEHGVIGVLATSSPNPEAFSFVDERWLRVVAAAAAPHLEVARLKRLAITDPLTSALNRRGLDTLYPAAGGRDDEPWSAGLVDIDGFKHINDRFGHPAGDDVLRGLVRAMGEVLRASDRIVRLGGEEFLVVLPAIGLAVARTIVERLREAVATAELLPGLTITVSIGVAERRHAESCDALLRRTDAALYQAKALGKNCVVVDEG